MNASSSDRRGEPGTLRVLASGDSGRGWSRRGFLGLGLAAGAGATLTACGAGGGKPASSTGPQPRSGPVEDSLRIFTFAEYIAEANLDTFSAAKKTRITVDTYDSVEQALAKIELGKGTSGYDLLVCDGAYIPQSIKRDLFLPLDKSLIPNLANVDAQYLNPIWDRGNKYSVVKDGGTTGVVYDSAIITTPIRTWTDFFDAAAGPARGATSVLDAAPSVVDTYFWANDMPSREPSKSQLDAAEDFLLKELAPHIKRFESYPSQALASGDLALAQVYNGDGRVALRAGPKSLRYVLPEPRSDLYFDNWTILANATHPKAAHAFIDYVLDPAVSAREVRKHGYNTGVVGVRDQLGDIDHADIIFPTAKELARLEPGVVDASHQRITEIFSKLKAAAIR